MQARIWVLVLFQLLFHPIYSDEPSLRRVLFIMDKLEVGGAERAFIDLMNGWEIPNTKVDILLLERNGTLEPFLRKDFPIVSTQEAFKTQYDAAVSFGEWIKPDTSLKRVFALRKIQWIHTDLLASPYKQPFKNRESCNGIDTFVCVSEKAAQSARKIQPQLSNKIVVIYNPINADLIKKKAMELPSCFPNDGILNVVTVGRLVKEKAFDRAIKVHSHLSKEGISFRWYIVGEGYERQCLENKIVEYQLQNKFILLGKKLNPYPYIAQADIFVMPSLLEGWCLAVTEAKVLHRPLLFTDVGGATEQITLEKNGLIVENSELGIYRGLRRLLLNKKLRDNLTKELQKFEYSNKKIYEQVEKILFPEQRSKFLSKKKALFTKVYL